VLNAPHSWELGGCRALAVCGLRRRAAGRLFRF